MSRDVVAVVVFDSETKEISTTLKTVEGCSSIHDHLTVAGALLGHVVGCGAMHNATLAGSFDGMVAYASNVARCKVDALMSGENSFRDPDF